ncbi:MAG: RIP metalloprotease RseP [Flavobacteriaceae bacterium TMED212]|nr:MAG: RIP metalloprotease RseP [Flavobacteriaceae bacterium TMED212]|tara:strand:+ start:4401 stop:5717 length:1317 start_codon:yes stop_codon:yes gene_type:complete
MEPMVMKGIQLLLSLSLLIVLHELGHFIPAKIFKTRVEKFFLFFDVKFALFKKKIGDTVYGVGWLPLGGYVKISGMIDESMDKEQMEKPPQPWEFRTKPAWQRLIIMLGGVTVNLILGFFIYMMILFVWGKNTLPNSALPMGMGVSSLGKEIGFEKGDQILMVDGKPLEVVLDINKMLLIRSVEEVQVQRANGNKVTLEIPIDIGERMFSSGQMNPLYPLFPAEIDSVLKEKNAFTAGFKAGDKIVAADDIVIEDWLELRDFNNGKANQAVQYVVERNKILDTLNMVLDVNGKMGVIPRSNIKISQIKLSLVESIKEGFSYGYWTLYDYVAQFKYVFTKKGASQLGGFGAIGSLFPASWDWRAFWASTAFISIILAFMNLLPIPALDGGHVMFLLYEMITGRKPNERFMEYAQMVGFFLLLALVIYANGNDLFRFLSN